MSHHAVATGPPLTRLRARLGLVALGQIAQAAAAAAVAWELALQLPEHGRPFFAPMAAAIALNAELGRRGRQAVQMVTGVAVGIVVGTTIVAAAGSGTWQIFVGALATLTLTTAAGAARIVRGQAASSAIIVIALYGPSSPLTFQRLEDAAIGGAVALVLARFLLPIDPIPLIRDEARSLRMKLAASLDEVARAIATADEDLAQAAVTRIWSIDNHALIQAMAMARDVAHAAPRRRPLRRRLDKLGEVYLELQASVYDAHAIATGVVSIISTSAAPSAEALTAVEAAANAVRAIDPHQARDAAAFAREAAQRLRDVDAASGAGVVAHGVASLAAHTLRAADAREEERRLAS